MTNFHSMPSLGLFAIIVINYFSSSFAYDCIGQANRLNASNANLALLAGITWPNQSPNDFMLCYQIGRGPAVNVQLDTGSTGIVIDKFHVGDYNVVDTGYCQSFLYDSSDNAYWGSMKMADVTIFGSDADGRFLRTTSMPILSVEIICSGKNCLKILNGEQIGTNDCQYVRNRLSTNDTVRASWSDITMRDGIAMMGVGYDRGASFEGYLHPQPLTRNAALRINADSLLTLINGNTSDSSNSIINTDTISAMCSSVINATQYNNCNDLGACNSPNYEFSCWADPADPTYSMKNTATNVSVIGYVISRQSFLLMIQSTKIKSNIVNYSIFNCVQLPSLPVNTGFGVPGHNCFNANAVQGQNRILNSSSLDSSAVYQSQGALLPDTGLKYELYQPTPKPELFGDHAIKFQFPVQPLNWASNSASQPASLSWTFVAELSNELIIDHNGGYYNVTQSNPAMHGPEYIRFINNTGVPLNQISGNIFNQSGFVNSGRFLMTDFAYFIDLQSGVAGFAPFESYQQARVTAGDNNNGARCYQSIQSIINLTIAVSMIILLIA